MSAPKSYIPDENIMTLRIYSWIFAIGAALVLWLFRSTLGTPVEVLIMVIAIICTALFLVIDGFLLKDEFVRHKTEPIFYPFPTVTIIILLLKVGIIAGNFLWYAANDAAPKLPEKAQTVENITVLKLNPLADFDHYSKSAVYDLRKKYVEASLFKKSGYEPNETVFGSIESNKPWYGIKNTVCFDFNDPSLSVSEGPSSMSRYINNPDMLIGIQQTYVFPKNDKYYQRACDDRFFEYLPARMTYDKKNNRITASYYAPDYVKNMTVSISGRKHKLFFTLITVNAIDAGYKYGFIDDKRNVFMEQEYDNLSLRVMPFNHFFHVGGSCHKKGGCNNVSPTVHEMEFSIQDLPAHIDIKLWKSEPLSSQYKGNLNYRIEFLPLSSSQ